MSAELSQSNQSALASLSQSKLVLLADEDRARSVCGSWINSISDPLGRPTAVFLLSFSGLAVFLLSSCLCFDSVLLPQSHLYSAPDVDATLLVQASFDQDVFSAPVRLESARGEG